MPQIPVDFSIKSGLPFSMDIVVNLPDGRSWWTSTSQFEVLAQIREEADETSTLITDISDSITVTMIGNVVSLALRMTGAKTREVTDSGAYDIIMSDTGTTDARAYPVSYGKVKRSTVVTAAEVAP